MSPTDRPSQASPSAAQLLRGSYASAAERAERGYLLYLPAGYEESPDQWPVLVFLHGNGERGNGHEDLDYLLKNGPLYEAWIQKRELPFLIIAPQLPMYDRDREADYLRERSRAEIPQRLAHGIPPRPEEFTTPQPMDGKPASSTPPLPPYGPPMGWPELEKDVLDVLAQVESRYRVDSSRVYLTGVSYGGFGTWYLGSRHVDRFAALAPVVGFGHPDLMPPIAEAQTPVWCFAGGRDTAVALEHFYTGLNRLEELGHRSVRFTVEADMGHDVWARVYRGHDLYDWLLEHSLDRSKDHPR